MAQKRTASRAKSASSRQRPRRSEPSERYKKAVEAFERAVKTLHKGDLEKASSQFENVISAFPDERELADRARAFMRACERRLHGKRRFSPKDLESTVAYGVFLHNEGDYQGAIDTLAKAVEMEPKSDHAHYCLAASYARAGDIRGAARHLKRAIAADPYNRVLALMDADFAALRGDPGVSQLLSEKAS